MPPRTPATICALVADAEPESRIFAASTLSAAGFHVTMANSFEEARKLLITRPPTLLVTDVRLGDHNGLQLVLALRYAQSPVAAVVTYDMADRALQAEAHRTGATFVIKPVGASELLAAVFRTLWRDPGDMRPVDAPFERRNADQRRGDWPVDQERPGTDRRRDLSLLIRGESVVM